MGAQELGPIVNEKISDALDTEGGAHAVTIGNIPSLEWFQAIPNGKSRVAKF